MNARLFLCVLGLVVVPALAPAQVQQEWVRRSVGPNRNDRPWAIQTDIAGNVYVTGSTFTTNGYDFVTLKYATDGALLWTALFNSGGTNSGDYAQTLAVDADGNVYVFGSSSSMADPSRLTLVKYRPNGSQLWVAHFA